LTGETAHYFKDRVLTHKPGLVLYMPPYADYSARTTSPSVYSIAIHFYQNKPDAQECPEPAIYPAEDDKRLGLIFMESLKRYSEKKRAGISG
jgi:hypothetical protein